MRKTALPCVVLIAAGGFLAGVAGTPAAGAAPCPDVEVVFARGTNEPPGPGFVGQAFTDSLGAQLPGRSVTLYAVNYPANDDYLRSAAAGTDDATTHIEGTLAACPDTRIVLGGFSQGAAVTEMSTSALPPQAADRVAAVALFGDPSSEFSRMLAGGSPLPSVAPAYGSKTIDLCLPDDPICSPGANMMAHVSYVPSGLAAQAAAFAAGKVGPPPEEGS